MKIGFVVAMLTVFALLPKSVNATGPTIIGCAKEGYTMRILTDTTIKTPCSQVTQVVSKSPSISLLVWIRPSKSWTVAQGQKTSKSVLKTLGIDSNITNISAMETQEIDNHNFSWVHADYALQGTPNSSGDAFETFNHGRVYDFTFVWTPTKSNRKDSVNTIVGEMFSVQFQS